MPRSATISCVVLALMHAAVTASAGLLTLAVVSGATSTEGTGIIGDPLSQESLSGSTLAQLGTPLLVDPATGVLFGLTVRITNSSDREIAFPQFLPGVSVLSSISGIPGYASRTNVAAGGAARPGGSGVEGAVSRGVLDMSGPLEAVSSPAGGSNGGGGGAATGVADCWIAVTGASGADLAPYLAGLRLAPGEWVDVPDFVRVLAFGRDAESARIALGFDLPTFSSGGVSVTCSAWTGAYSGPAPPGAGGQETTQVPEPGTALLCLTGLVALGARRLRAPGLGKIVENSPREHR